MYVTLGFMLNYIFPFFFKWWYRLRPPKSVKNLLGGFARVKKNPQGHYEMQVKGEDEGINGFPRGPILFSTLAKLKHEVKTRVFNEVASDLKRLGEELKVDMIEPDKMVPAVKHIWDTFERLEHMEVTEDMKGRIKLMKECICFFLDLDDGYRFRAQMFLWLLNQNKVKLSKRDMYNARAKYWKPDRYLRLFGKIWDKHEY